MIQSKCVDDFIRSFTFIIYHQIKLVWVPGHQGIRGNEKADECAVRGSSLVEATACNDVMTPPVVVANKIDDWALHECRWSTINTCRISRTLWPFRLRKRTQTLLSLDKIWPVMAFSRCHNGSLNDLNVWVILELIYVGAV